MDLWVCVAVSVKWEKFYEATCYIYRGLRIVCVL